MRLWLARFFTGLAFSLLLAHNLFAHHHDDHTNIFGSHFKSHQEATANTSLFDNIVLDANHVYRFGIEHCTTIVHLEILQVRYHFVPVEVVMKAEPILAVPDHPPTSPYRSTFALRGPPVYC